jgi:dTDP-4-dehydrorhamnose reductase
LGRDHSILGTIFTSKKIPPFHHAVIDLRDDRGVGALMESFQPDVIVHAAAMSKVAECEDHPEQARQINVDSTACLVRWAQRCSAKLIYFSSDQVFDGRKGGYRESDSPHPVGQYGLTKLEAERLVLDSPVRALVIRSNSVVGRAGEWGESFSDWIIRRLCAGQPVPLYRDQFRSPIHIRAMTDLVAEACLSELTGLLHAGGPRRMSRLDLGFAAARAYGLSADLIADESYLSHPHQSVMTPDTSYDISRLKQLVPQLIQAPLDEEFTVDATEKRSAI